MSEITVNQVTKTTNHYLLIQDHAPIGQETESTVVASCITEKGEGPVAATQYLKEYAVEHNLRGRFRVAVLVDGGAFKTAETVAVVEE